MRRHWQPAAEHDTAQIVEKLSQRILPCGASFSHQLQVGRAKLPLSIDVNGSRLVARRFHSKRIAWNFSSAQLFKVNYRSNHAILEHGVHCLGKQVV